jgi:hypothetical protein
MIILHCRQDTATHANRDENIDLLQALADELECRVELIPTSRTLEEVRHLVQQARDVVQKARHPQSQTGTLPPNPPNNIVSTLISHSVVD